jgi:CBS domain containing-hemolysin-like protein
MIWLLLILGLLVAILGSAGSAAVVTTARADLAEAISRRLRGEAEPLDWLAERESLVVAATSLSALGVIIIAVIVPGIFDNLTLPRLGLLLLFLVVPATLLGGYLLPRWLTVPRADRMLSQLRPPLSAARAVLQLVMPATRHTMRDDLHALAREGSANGIAPGDELVMVGGVMSFAERPAREVMTPRTDVVAVSSEAGYHEVLALFGDSGYTRLPVYRESLDDIIGMVHAFDLFKLAETDPVPVRPVAFAPESRPAADLLLDMQRERRHFAVVMDEFGGTAGIVTLEDLLEALVGEISDDDDDEISPASTAALLLLDGTADTDQVAAHFEVVLPRGEATSFGGLLIELAGRIPVPGERFRLSGLIVDVLEATPNRIERIAVRRLGPPAIELVRNPV